MARRSRRLAWAWVLVAALWSGVFLGRVNAVPASAGGAPRYVSLHQIAPENSTQGENARPFGSNTPGADLSADPLSADPLSADPLSAIPTPAAPVGPAVTLGPVGFPTYEVNAVPAARARDVYSRQHYQRATRQLAATYRDARDAYETSVEYRAIVAEEEAAAVALRDARTEALRPLDSDPDYRARLDVYRRVSEQLDTPASLPPDGLTASAAEFDPLFASASDERRALAEIKLRVGRELRELEAIYLANAPFVAEAAERLRHTSAEAAEFRRAREREVRFDPQVAALRETVEDWRIARLVSAAYLDSAIRARDAYAIPFALVSRRTDRYVPRLAPYGGRYGTSFGTPFVTSPFPTGALPIETGGLPIE